MTTKKPPFFVELDRRFIHWGEQYSSIEAIASLEQSGHATLDWPKLLERRRVVVLAEAGSGKSEELKRQAERLAEAGEYAFHATVEDVAKDGLESALGRQQLVRFRSWQQTAGPAYFFVDSIDEAKLCRIQIDKAFRRLDEGIADGLARAHIVLSGRYTDWEFESDLNRLEEMLPAPQVVMEPELPTPELVGKILNNEWRPKKPTPAERPLVVLMASLDAARIRKFAVERKVANLDQFMAAIEEGSLWSLARRPLDLSWMVAFWDKERRLGSLTEMLEMSLRERLRESKAVRIIGDTITDARGMAALERIGAAMVFGRTDKIIIPESGQALQGDGLALQDVLPDWSEEERRRFFARPVFDPATFGRARLHNDNEGVVRGYLAARWLQRRLENGCSTTDLLALLFAEKYGIRVVKPSVRQTVAWLSANNADVAREVVAREPRLLLEVGDPAALSAALRGEALTSRVKQLIEGGRWFGWTQRENLRRFAKPDLASHVRQLWMAHRQSEEVSHLLLQLVWLGRMSANADILDDVVFGAGADRTSRVIAVRGLIDIGDPIQLERYASSVKADPKRLSRTELWIAVEELFGKHLSVAELLTLLGAVEWTNIEEGGIGFDRVGPELVGRISEPDALETLIDGLLIQLGPIAEEHEYHETDLEKAFAPAIRAAAVALLNMVGPDLAPDAAVNAAIRLCARRFHHNSDGNNAPLTKLLSASWQRRKAHFWRAAATAAIAGNSFIRGKPVTDVFRLQISGWNMNLCMEDVDWLLEDAARNSDSNNRLLAFHALLTIWRENDKDAALLERLRPLASLSPEAKANLDHWISPPSPTPEEIEQERGFAKSRAKHAKETARRDKSWVRFVADLKANPDLLRNPPPVPEGRVDVWRYNFWRLLNAVTSRDTRYQIEDVEAIKPLVGAKVAEAGRDGLIAFWRSHRPQIESERAPDKKNVVNMFDIMALVGVSLEAHCDPHWAAKLTSSEAERAAECATLEMNGLPTWLPQLSAVWPAEVERVLMREIAEQLTPTNGEKRYGTLQYIAHGASEIAELIARPLALAIRERAEIAPEGLSDALSIVTRGLSESEPRQDFYALMIERFRQSGDDEIAGKYLYGAFRIDPASATGELVRKIEGLDLASQTAWGQRVFPLLFGDRLTYGGIDPALLDFATLELLTRIAFQTIRPADDPQRTGVHSIDARHNSESARYALFNRIAQTPGEATVAALRRLAVQTETPPDQLATLIGNRAAEDAEAAPWLPGEAKELENLFDLAPRTPADLQTLALARIREIDHYAHTGDFAQGGTLKSLGTETEVQNWVANELFLRRRRGYTAERESEVFDGKKPDIRLRSGDVSLPIEIKIAEKCPLAALEKALDEQLGSRYLRNEDARHGVLLLIHKKARASGWSRPGRRPMRFEEVVLHLQVLAEETAGSSHDAPRAKIAVLDVSDLA